MSREPNAEQIAELEREAQNHPGYAIDRHGNVVLKSPEPKGGEKPDLLKPAPDKAPTTFTVRVTTEQGANVEPGDTIGHVEPSDVQKAIIHLTMDGGPDEVATVKILSGEIVPTAEQVRHARMLKAQKMQDPEFVRAVNAGERWAHSYLLTLNAVLAYGE